MSVPQPKFRLLYKGKNITEDISKYLINLTFNDKVEGEADEVSIRLEDTDEKWQGSWYPTKGDRMELFIGYDESMVKAGRFAVDDITFSGPPDELAIRAQAAPIDRKLRTRRSTAFENVTVKQVAEKIAQRNGLTLDGLQNLGENGQILHERVSQNRETDLQFLKRFAAQYGITFTVRDTKLVLTDQQTIEKRPKVLTIDKRDCSRWDFRDKSVRTFQAAQASFKNPRTDRVVQSNVRYEPPNPQFGVLPPRFFNEQASGEVFKEYGGRSEGVVDTLQTRVRAENQQQAEAQAQAALYRANTNEKEGTITVYGNPLILAGNNIELTGFGQLSGTYHVKESTHSFDKSGGYSTTAELKKVSSVPKNKQRTTNRAARPSTARRWGGAGGAF